VCVCISYCKYCIELCYKAPISGIFVMFLAVCHCKYYNELCYKAPICSMVCFQWFSGHKCHKIPKTMFPQGGGVCNSPMLVFHVNG